MRRILIMAFLCVVLAACQSTGNTSGSSAPSAPLASSEGCWWVYTCFETAKTSDGRYGKVVLNFKGSAEPMTVRVLVTQNGMNGTYEPVQQFALKDPARREILELRAQTGSSYNWRWRFNQHPGTEPATHDDSVIYRLPYEDGEEFEVIQTYGGAFSHSGDNYNAIDWYMPVGTPILAARDGTVALVRSESDRKGRGQDNHVIIRHDDGTYAWYLHLRQGGTTVEIGETVAAGDLIGYSGDTGFSTRPHLHFQVSSVSANPNKLYDSFKTKFATSDGITERLKRGVFYEARPLVGS